MTIFALTIGGSDPTGGAGIQQDLSVFRALEVRGLSAITAVTAQGSVGVSAWEPVPGVLVSAQIAAVVADMGVRTCKAGMLANEDVVTSVARAVRDFHLELILDPVMTASRGGALIDAAGVAAIHNDLLPLVALVTPNADEARVLTGIDVRTRDDQERAAQALVAMGAQAALVKGGHLPGARSIDVLVWRDRVYEFAAVRVQTGDVHGTGCVLSAAITAWLARGHELEDAIDRAKIILTTAIRGAVERGEEGFLEVRA